MSKEKNEQPFPEYITDAFVAFKPPEKLTVSEWADRYRVLSARDSASPGPWRTARTPYLKDIMNAFNNKAIKEITFCAGTQLGKTAMEQNMIGFAVAQDPGPMIIIYPTDKLAEFTSENRLQPMIELSEPLKARFDKEGSQRLELQFDSMYIGLVGANSPSNLSSRPVRYIFFDEIDKFPKWSGEEASPIALAEERTKTFWNKKIVKISTPTLSTGNIWKAWETADAQYKFFVPCPHCGKFQEMEFKQLKFDSEMPVAQVKYAAYYECCSCHGRIDDRQKPQMLSLGRWKLINKPAGRVHSVAYHLNSIYSPWVTFGDVAAKFLSARDAPEELMNFINSWLAEPWVNKASRMQSDVIMEKQLGYDEGRVPNDVRLITMGVDVQLDHFWWGIRGWSSGLTSYLIAYGRAEAWGDIEMIMQRNYADMNGEIRNVNLCCIDSGYNTDEVYQFCAMHSEQCIPTKGASKRLTTRYNISVIDRGIASGLRLYVFDSNQFKDFVQGRLSIQAGERGSWNVYQGIDRRYCDQLCAEQKVEHKDKKGRVTLEWEKVSSHAQNHMLDVETNNALAAEILGVRYLTDESTAENSEEADTSEEQEGNSWLGNVGSNWF